MDDSISNPKLGSIFDRSAKDPVNAMAENIAAAYGVEMTYPGTTGTTGLNVPAVMALAGEGEKIGIARDCHVSVVASLSLSGAEPVYLVPPFDSHNGVLLPPTRGEVASLLNTHPDVRALVLTMPTYHGLMGDIAGIVDECHGRGVLVMVDGAHGPHFHFLRGLGFPCPAENAGADMVTQSTHKVMSALNQGSLLHFNNLALIPRYEEFQAMGFQSTSFSYPILLSLEHAIEQMIVDGERSWARAVWLARRLREEASRLPGVNALDEAIVDGRRVVGLDPTRVTLNVRSTGRSGYEICNGLLDHGVIVEMATADVLLFLVSPSVTDSFVDSTVQALRAVLEDARDVGRGGGTAEPAMPPALPDRVRTPRQAMAAPRERVPRRKAVGRVSGESIGCYPPGQAVFVPGELITAEAVDYLESVVEAGGHLKRVDDDHFLTINVLRDPNPGG
jgi:ornithine decarboxylase